MSDQTKIQWCSSTVNPIMGCGGCELFPAPAEVLGEIDRALGKMVEWPKETSRAIFRRLVEEAFANIANPLEGHSRAISTTNIWHFRELFVEEVAAAHGKKAGQVAAFVIGQAVTCYAARLHLNKGRSLLNPTRQANPGYAPAFEKLTRFQGRVWKMAGMKDLFGADDPDKPWMQGLPRLIFVSDMGDAFSNERDFGFLEAEVIEPIRSAEGAHHLWLWLTKRPDRMARFGEKIRGFPPNVCAMTTITGPAKLDRIEALRYIPASVSGLSLEPLWERIPANRLNLYGISWVIAGGESGRAEYVRPFDVEWAEEIRDHCQRRKAAFFLEQLGRVPRLGGDAMILRDNHGGDWDEWPETLRVREFPEYFHQYRRAGA